MKANLSYAVSVSRIDDAHARAETRGHALTLNIKKGSGEAGFNAAETLLSALGACILTNVNAISEKMRLDIRSARIEFYAERQDEPPILTQIKYRLILDSPEPQEKLEELHQLCIKWGTVTNTVIKGLTPQGSLIISPERKQSMKIKIAAVSDDGQTISQHFGRARYYIVLTIEDGKIIAREQREKLGHAHFAGETHTKEQDPRGHGFAPAEQDRHFRMAEAIKDCQYLLARGMGAGAYYSMEQVGITPIITNIPNIDEAALQAAQGKIVNHKENLH